MCIGFIDMVPEDRLDHVLDYLAELSEGDEPLRERAISLDEYFRLE